MSTTAPDPTVRDGLSLADYRALAAFRYHLRGFLAWSELRARQAGLEPQQQQLLLAIKGLPECHAPTIGVLAGFTTLIANAAGPLMAIYLLAMRLPKMDYVGTGAVFFLLMNLFKVPFMVNLGLITWPSFQLNLLLAVPVFAGTMVGRRILTRIDQRLFENIVLFIGAAAGVKLLF